MKIYKERVKSLLEAQIRIAEKEANDAKKELVAKLSHDIKTPLAIIRADTEVLELQIGEDNEWLASIKNQTKRLDTLIKTLLGIIKPFSGQVEKSSTITLGYFEQEVPGNRNTPLDEIWDSFPTLNQGEVHAALAACGLTHEHIESQIITLSGGEAAKVRLCKLTIGEYNCLVLDEPTNHLDVLSKEALQDAINQYKGTILLVCHESDFYQSVASRVINLEDFAL